METVEELCQSIAILDQGRLVVGGTVRDVRRVTGRQVVRLAVAGDPEIGWVEGIEGGQVTRRGQDYVEIQVPRDRDPEAILKAALARGCRILHFEIADPSIEQVFIEKVGGIDRTERTLAPKALH